MLIKINNDFIYDNEYPQPDGFGQQITWLFKKFAKVDLLFTYIISDSYDKRYGFKYNNDYYEFEMINREDFIEMRDDGSVYYIMTDDSFFTLITNICYLINVPIINEKNKLLYCVR